MGEEQHHSHTAPKLWPHLDPTWVFACAFGSTSLCLGGLVCCICSWPLLPATFGVLTILMDLLILAVLAGQLRCLRWLIHFTFYWWLGGGIQGVIQVSHKYLEHVWKCLHVGVLDDLKSSGSCLKSSEIVWICLIQTFQIFGKILMDPVGSQTFRAILNPQNHCSLHRCHIRCLTN